VLQMLVGQATCCCGGMLQCHARDLQTKRLVIRRDKLRVELPEPGIQKNTGL